MRLQFGAVRLDLASDLLEEALLARARAVDPALERELFEEREAVGSIEIVDIREQSFRDLDARWTRRLGLCDPLIAALEATSLSAGEALDCVVEKVRRGAEEGAKLLPGGSRMLRLTIAPDTLLSRERLEALLRSGS